jgi:hypothetical protein
MKDKSTLRMTARGLEGHKTNPIDKENLSQEVSNAITKGWLYLSEVQEKKEEPTAPTPAKVTTAQTPEKERTVLKKVVDKNNKKED